MSESGETPRNIYLQALGATMFASGYIFGPMILFMGSGWWIGEQIGSKAPLFVGLGIAMVSSYILLFWRLPRHMKKLQEKLNRN